MPPISPTMTTSDIIRIVSTVAVSQLICDWLANWWYFSQEPYKRSVDNLERARAKLGRVKKEVEDAAPAASGNNNSQNTILHNKHHKKLQRAEDECKEIAAEIAQKHTIPQLFISIFFLMLLRIFGTEYAGRPIAILPFAPIRLLQRVTGRGLDLSLSSSLSDGTTTMMQLPLLQEMAESSGQKVTDVTQACSFLLIYILASLSVKYYIHKLFGTEPPAGADQGLATIMESPQTQLLAKRLGLDPAADQGTDHSNHNNTGKTKSTASSQGKKSKKNRY